VKRIITLALVLLLVTACIITNGQNCSNEIVQFRETFGNGTVTASLPNGRTNYHYNGATALTDGDYTLHETSQRKPEWHAGTDHTGGLNGRMMVTNASYTPGEFYRDTVYNLSSLTTYAVYLYAMNVNKVGTCAPNPILPRLQLVVESYNIDGSFTELSSMVSNDLPQMTNPTWVLINGFITVPGGVTAVRYRIINNSTGGCGNDVAIDDITFSQCSLISLPVSGLSLKAQSSGSKTELFWTTIQESGSDKFIAEKSVDGLTWKPFASVKAAGHSSVATDYHVADQQGGLPLTYYRVAAVDLDGKIIYSNKIVVKGDNKGTQLSAFPNPFIGSLSVNVSVTENKPGAVVKVFDFKGALISATTWNLKQGSNITTFNSLDRLPSGLYFLDVSDASGMKIARSHLVKQ